MMTRITGTGSYVPPLVVDNHKIAEMVDTSDEWIRERTGIAARHIADEDTTVSMAVKAARKAVADAGMAAGELDLIIVATNSSNVLMPSTACCVQREIGAENAVCFDLTAACSGFLYAYNTALSYMVSGLCSRALVIGSEALSTLVDWTDRGTCILFGDGAGAAVIAKDDSAEFYQPVMHSNGADGDALTAAARISGNGMTGREAGDYRDRRYYIGMDGQRVFKFAVSQVPHVIEELLTLNQVDKAEISHYVLHQANERIIASVARRLKEDIGKFPMNMSEYGNTSSASIPLLLDELNRSGQLQRGELLVLAGFGAGLTWGASLIRW